MDSKRHRTESAYNYGARPNGIAIGSDHAGLGLKKEIIKFLQTRFPDLPVKDCGTYTEDRVDYPDIARSVCSLVQSGECNRGILLDGAGVASGIAANKFNGVRCAVVHDHFSISMGRKHNDCNVVSLGGKTLGIEAAKEILEVFITCDFEGDRHIPRLQKLEAIESEGGSRGGRSSVVVRRTSTNPAAASPFKLPN